MVNKVKISINNNTLFFTYKKDNVDYEKLLNTNIISNDELLFSEEYIDSNLKIVSSFIREIANENKINSTVVETQSLTAIALRLLKNIPQVNTLYIKETVSLTYLLCEKIIENKNIKFVNCYSIPPFMIELLDQKGIKSESRFEVFFTSNFMQNNGLVSYSKIYYKMNLRLDLPVTNEDIEDFKTFCKLNKYLKTVHLPKYDKKTIKNIIDILHSERIKNVRIMVHDNINDQTTALELKALNKKIKRKYKLSVKVIYSKDYLNANLGSELIFSTLKMCGLVIFVLIGVVMGCICFANYHSLNKVEEIKREIETVVNEYIGNEPYIDDSTLHTNKYSALKNINEDTVGWITIKNTNIDYPIVQADDNDYYLDKDFNHNSNYDGWIFMDYRNNINSLDKNTIIYGHNHYYSGVMFGTLSEVTKKKWLDNLSNQIITFDTINSTGKWQVFSVYKIKKTSDYLKVEFETDEEFLEFANMLKNRSLHDFMVEIQNDDNILTLSTCIDDDSRLVVHAILIK